MDRCTVCDSANLNGYTHRGSTERHAWWCEDCGSMHSESGTSRPEKSMLHHQVVAFHKKFGQPIAARPHVPSEAMVRFRLRLITEEFFELLEAALDDPTGRLDLLHGHVRELINDDALDVELLMLVDALGDLDYVIEGTRVVFGVDGQPVADEIQRANMAKEAVTVVQGHVAGNRCWKCGVFLNEQDGTVAGNNRECENSGRPHERACSVCPGRCTMRATATTKPTKPPGWQGPDIDRVLIEQGWKP